MSEKQSINELTIKGFKSIKQLNDFGLGSLNVLIGPNGVGKSNFISYFRMLAEMVEGRLQTWVRGQGSADRILSFGLKETDVIESFIKFGINGYKFSLKANVDDSLSFIEEKLFFDGPYYGKKWISLGSGHTEAKIRDIAKDAKKGSVESYCYNSISSWKIFHFHDTSETAGVKRLGSLHDNDYLRPDASNLAAYLFKLKDIYPDTYEKLRNTIRLGIPFFDDFVFKPQKLSTEEEQIRLLWKQVNSDYALWPSQLSDGSLRFICLVTVLLQPDPPSTIIIDEPELGLHPYAITLLGSLLRSASKRMQVIVSTQSVPLLNEFSIDNLIIVERQDGASVFKRLYEEDFESWLQTYSIGELWEKNILGGRPTK